MICKKCKAEIPEGCPFCVKCGTEIDNFDFNDFSQTLSQTAASAQNVNSTAQRPNQAQRQAAPRQAAPRQAQTPPVIQSKAPVFEAEQASASHSQPQKATQNTPPQRSPKPFSKQPPSEEKPIYLPKDKNAKKIKILTVLVVLLLVMVLALGVKIFTSCEHVFLAATCEKAQVCELCGETRGEMAGHKVNDWEVVKKATCIEKGEQKGVCVVCQKEVTTEIETGNHVAGKWETVLSADENGHPKKVLRCINCGEIIEEQEIEGEAVNATEITSTTQTTKAPEDTTTSFSTSEAPESTEPTSDEGSTESNAVSESTSQAQSETAENEGTVTEATSQIY